MEVRAEYLGRPVERPRLTVVKDGSAQQPKFAALPHVIIRKKSLSRDARLLVAVLQMYGWQGSDITASHATMADDMGCSTRMLRQYLDELIEAGIVTEQDAGVRRQKVYRLVSIGTVLPIETHHSEKQASDCTPSNRKFSTGQSEVFDTFNRKQASDSKKKTPVKKTKEEELLPPVVDAADAVAMAAVPDQVSILRGLSAEAREILDWHRQCHGKRQPAKLNPESARVLEEAVADLGVDRLKESVRYMAGKIPAVPELSKAIRAARTKRTQDESGASPNASRNGASQIPPGAASKQQTRWADWKGRHGYGSNAVNTGRDDGR